MSRTIKQATALFLVVTILGILAWRLWPDGGRARREQRNDALVRAVQTNDLNAAIRLLDGGADPNAQEPAPSFTQRVQKDYNYLSHGLRAPSWSDMDNLRSPVLQIAVTHDKVSMVKALLAKGAEVGHRDKVGNTALSWAQMLSGGSVRASGTQDQNLILALLKAAEARK